MLSIKTKALETDVGPVSHVFAPARVSSMNGRQRRLSGGAVVSQFQERCKHGIRHNLQVVNMQVVWKYASNKFMFHGHGQATQW